LGHGFCGIFFTRHIFASAPFSVDCVRAAAAAAAAAAADKVTATEILGVNSSNKFTARICGAISTEYC
jgi:hypothetical protein